PFAFLPPFKTVSTGLRTAFPFTSRACLIPTVRLSGLPSGSLTNPSAAPTAGYPGLIRQRLLLGRSRPRRSAYRLESSLSQTGRRRFSSSGRCFPKAANMAAPVYLICKF
ncbi:TPA: hypothetical protein ACFIYF_002155, partial [Neisseria gonorrhoeae]